MLNIISEVYSFFKPIISIEDGLLHTKSKPRNLKKAEKQIFSDFRKSFATGKVKECTVFIWGAVGTDPEVESNDF